MRPSFYLLLLIFCALTGLGALQAQAIEVPQTQRSVITKKTADWCPLCGSWGWTLFRQLLEDNANDATFIAAHHSGGLANPVASAIAANLAGQSQPRFYVNNADQNAQSGNVATVRANVRQLVLDQLNQAPIAQSGLRATYQGDSLIVRVNTELFADWAAGDLFLGVYLIERTVIAPQSSQGNMAEHKQILRRAATATWYGEAIVSGPQGAGHLVESEYRLPLNGLLTENLEVATILWRANGNTYDIVNTNSTKEIEEEPLVGVEAVRPLGVAWQVAPNVVETQATIQLSLANRQDAVSLQLFDLQGRRLASLYTGALPAGEHQFPLWRQAAWPAGVYVLQISLGQQRWAERLIFR